MKNLISIKPVLKLIVFISMLVLVSRCKEDSGSPIFANSWTAYGLSSSWTASGLSGNFSTLAVGRDMVVAGTNKGIPSEGKAYVYTDDGNSWHIANDGLPNQAITALIVVNDTILLGTGGSVGSGIYKSTNKGNYWQAVIKGLPINPVDSLADINSVTSFAVSSTNASVGQRKIFVNTGIGIFVSADNGSSWQAASNGLPANGGSALAVNGNRIFAGIWRISSSSGGVYVSDDFGMSWHDGNNGLSTGEIYAIAVCGNNIFASATSNNYGGDVGGGGGVYVSTDDGNSWQLANNGLPPWRSVSSFAVSGNIIFAGIASGEGVYFSNNNGNSWQVLNNGLTCTEVRALAVFNGNLFAATTAGIFVRPLK